MAKELLELRRRRDKGETTMIMEGKGGVEEHKGMGMGHPHPRTGPLERRMSLANA